MKQMSRQDGKRKAIVVTPEALLHPHRSAPSTFTDNQLRLVVFHDHEVSGRNVLFDSERHRLHSQQHGHEAQGKVGSDTNNEMTIDASQAPRKIRDQDLLGEMLYGSIPMVFDRSTTKMHVLKTPPSIMLSHAFSVYPYLGDVAAPPAAHGKDAADAHTSLRTQESYSKLRMGPTSGHSTPTTSSSSAEHAPLHLPIDNRSGW